MDKKDSEKNLNKIKKKEKKEKKVNNSLNKYYKPLLFFHILFFIFINDKIKGLIPTPSNKLKEEIIEENYYEDFEIIKKQFNNDSFLNSYLNEITILSHLYNKAYKELKKDKNIIHICMSLNDTYVYPILISMESILMNTNKSKTFIIFHILCSPEIGLSTLSILKTIINRHSTNLELILYDMGNNFMNLKHTRSTQNTFYKLLLPIMINSDRIIHLDADTLTFKDLSDMYESDFKDNYILGTWGYYYFDLYYIGIKPYKYINAGVILLNLEKIRKNQKYYELINKTNNDKYLRHDGHTVLNNILYPEIGDLSYKYNIFNFHHLSDAQMYAEDVGKNISIADIEESMKEPTIIQYSLCYPKIWEVKTKYSIRYSRCRIRNNCSCEESHNLWYYYANQTDYYKEIVKYFKKRRKYRFYK